MLIICIFLIFLLWIVYSFTIKCQKTKKDKIVINEENKEQIQNEIEAIKMIQLHPKFYIANYFSDLKTQVDLLFALKLNEKDKYMNIINTIELVEQECYNKIKPFIQFNDEIDQAQMNNDIKLLNDIKFKIEKEIFKNKTIHFIENFNNKIFLLIINDKYLRKSTITNECLKTNIINDCLNRENLSQLICFQTILKSNDTIIKLNTSLINLTEINFSNKQINEIHENTFHGLINIIDINFENNQIEIIHPALFKGLIKLKRINFDNNYIDTIDPMTFNGLTSLIEIILPINYFKELHPSTFKGLISLKLIDFGIQRIDELHQNIFTGLFSLKVIDFRCNNIQELHPNIFNGLIHLKTINFRLNKIKKLCPNVFNGLISLREIDFSSNNIQKLNSHLFNGLIYLKKINFHNNQIEDFDFDLSTFDELTSLKIIYIWNNLIVDKQYLFTLSSQLIN
jgi:Leucine-rich repeat (LRR) protein